MSRRLCRTYVDEETYNRFVERFGSDNSYGLVSYALETTMREMLDMTDHQPDFTDIVRQAVQIYVRKNKLTYTEQANDSATS